MKLNGKEWVWEDNGKYYYSTNEYGYHSSECNKAEFCYKQLAGARKKVEISSSSSFSSLAATSILYHKIVTSSGT